MADYGPRAVFLLTAAFPLLITVAAAAIPEQRVTAATAASPGSDGLLQAHGGDVGAAFAEQAKLLWATAKQPAILLPAVFVFLWQVSC